MAACFSGRCFKNLVATGNIEKRKARDIEEWISLLRASCKGKCEPNTAHYGFSGQSALASHDRQRR